MAKTYFRIGQRVIKKPTYIGGKKPGEIIDIKSLDLTTDSVTVRWRNGLVNEYYDFVLQLYFPENLPKLVEWR